MGDMPVSDYEKIKSLLIPLFEDLKLPDIEWDGLQERIKHDKKLKGDSINWVYPMGIGRIAVKELEPEVLEATWKDFSKKLAGWCVNAS